MGLNLAVEVMPAAGSGGGASVEAEAQFAQNNLQQWREVKEEGGTIAREFTQSARTWPL